MKNLRISPAIALSILAVFIALSGTATAAKVLITGKDIKKGSITGKNIKNGSITVADISAKSRKILEGQTGANGTNGANGATGPAAALPGGAVQVTSISGDWEPRGIVSLSPEGAYIGPLASNAERGGVIYHGLDGLKLKDLGQVSYTASYIHDPGPTGADGPDNGDAPYMLITLDGFDHDVAFSPSTQPGACYSGSPDPGPTSTQCASSGRTIHYEVSKGTVRYDDDPGSFPDQKWAKVVTDHPDGVISGIRVQAGYSLPGTAEAWVNSLTLEAKGSPPTTFYFGS